MRFDEGYVTKIEEENKLLRKLVEEEIAYRKLISEEMHAHIGLAIAHGYTGNEERYKIGVECRKRINKLRKPLGFDLEEVK